MAEEMVIVLVVGLAAGYLVRRYLKNKKAGSGCGCSNGTCDVKNTCSVYSVQEAVSDRRPGMENGEKGPCPMKARPPDG